MTGLKMDSVGILAVPWRFHRTIVCLRRHIGLILSVWDITLGERIIRLTGHPEGVHALSFSPCGQFLAAGGVKGTVQVGRLPRGSCIKRIHRPVTIGWTSPTHPMALFGQQVSLMIKAQSLSGR